MNLRFLYIILLGSISSCTCHYTEDERYFPPFLPVDSVVTVKVLDPDPELVPDLNQELSGEGIQTGKTSPETLVEYSKKLLGTPYLYASTDPSAGFDCSGFITYVFNHFHINVPRSSVDFTGQGKEVSLENAKMGDLILFTGTDSTIPRVGHMGIVVSNIDGNLQFIHSTSGKAKGVVITPFENYYKSRFVKVIRVFPDSFF